MGYGALEPRPHLVFTGGAKWAGRVEKGGIFEVVVRRFALLYLAQPATMVRTARPEIRSRPSALCWRVGILSLAARALLLLMQTTCIALLARLRGCDTAALSGMLVVRGDARSNVATQVE